MAEKSERIIRVPEQFAKKAHIGSMEKYRALYDRSVSDPDGFWNEQAERITWFKKWKTVSKYDFHTAKIEWFIGGKLNASANCLDRHLKGPRRDKPALVWEGDSPGESRTLTYLEVYKETCKFANALKKLGVKKGDRVTIFLPMVPELPIAMLACARIGAIHSVVFGGVSAEALKNRIQDCGSEVVITADGGYRGGRIVPLKQTTDESLKECPDVKTVVVLKRTGKEVPFNKGRDHWWHDLVRDVPAECEPEQMDAEDPLFILYTSGSTGKPTGVMHTTGGYMVADGDRRHPHHAASGRHRAEARVGDAPVLWRPTRDRGRPGQGPGRARHRQPLHLASVAWDHARGVRRCRSLPQDVLHHLPGPLLHRRRLPPRRGRLLLDHRPRRRRDQRQRPPPRHGGDRERAGLASRRGGSCRGGLPARDQGTGHLRVRDPQAGRRSHGEAAHRPGPARPQGHRTAGLPGRDPLGTRPAEDPLRQDHAADPAQDRSRRIRRPGRHFDAGGSVGGRQPGQGKESPRPEVGFLLFIEAVGEIVRRLLLLALQLLRALPDVVQLPLRRALSSGVASRRPGEGRPHGKCDRRQAQQQDEDFPETHVRRFASRRQGSKKSGALRGACDQCQIRLRRIPNGDQIQQGV